jgi:hypothetical protein
MMAAVSPPSRFVILERFTATAAWTGSRVTLGVHDGATMPQTAAGSMIFAFQNIATMNNAGKLALTSGASQPKFLAAPALATQPSILVHNWNANNLNVTNISANTQTPIWIEAYGFGLGPPAKSLPTDGTPVPVHLGDTLQTVTNPNWMQLSFQFNSAGLALFAFIGGPTDTGGNNAYVIAVNSPFGETGPPTKTQPPAGYYATTASNNYSFEFNWGSVGLFIAYFGSGQVVTENLYALVVPQPTVTLLSL